MPRGFDVPPARRLLVCAGLIALALWSGVWVVSVCQGRLVGGEAMWFRGWEYLGLDFLNPCLASRHWVAGGDPYHELFGDPREGTELVGCFCYPPVVLPLFSWCALLSPQAGIILWTGVLTALAAFGAVLAWRCRRRLGLGDVPLPCVLALFLCSTPVIFALERGNYDLLVLPLVAGAACALQRRSLPRDLTAGSCLALAAWLKLYPGLLILSLLTLRRWRALACCAGTAVVIGLAGLGYLPALRANLGVAIAAFAPAEPYHPCHSLSGCWESLWSGGSLAWLGHIPGSVATAGFILGLALAVSRSVYRSPDSRRVLFPYLLWLAGLASFFPRISNDYNFYYLPLVALAVWDRRDALLVHLSMAPLVLWWQPWAFPIGNREFFFIKLVGFLAVTASLSNRIRAQASGAVAAAETPAWNGAAPQPAAA